MWKARARSRALCARKRLPLCVRRGIDVTGHGSKHVDEFAGQQFDYVITVCDNARETCPVFFGKAEKLHHDFEDPAAINGSQEERLAVFRRVRDQLRAYLRDFSEGVA